MISSLDDMDNEIPDLLDWLRSNVQVEKVMSRSEAGKYAAEQRWKNHAKMVDPVRVLDSKYQKVADRINAGLQSLTEAGFQIGDIKTDKDHARFRNMYVQFNDFFEQQSELWRETKGEQGKQFPSHSYMGLRLIGRIVTVVPDLPSKNERLLVVHDGSVIAGAARALIYINNKTKLKTMSIEYMGSAQLVKGVGSAMYGELLKWGASQGVEAVELDPLDGAKSFWQSEMGMIWDGSDMIYADTQIGMIEELK